MVSIAQLIVVLVAATCHALWCALLFAVHPALLWFVYVPLMGVLRRAGGFRLSVTERVRGVCVAVAHGLAVSVLPIRFGVAAAALASLLFFLAFGRRSRPP